MSTLNNNGAKVSYKQVSIWLISLVILLLGAVAGLSMTGFSNMSKGWEDKFQLYEKKFEDNYSQLLYIIERQGELLDKLQEQTQQTALQLKEVSALTNETAKIVEQLDKRMNSMNERLNRLERTR